MPGRNRVHAPALGRQPSGAEREHLSLSGVEVVDHDVEVDLLRPVRVQPLRWLVIRGQLEGHARGRVVPRDHYEVRRLVGDRQAEQLGVERGQRGRVGAVDDHVMQPSDHGAIMPRYAA